MTGMEGRETEAGQPRKAYWKSWTLHAKRSEPVVIAVPLLTHGSKAKVQLTHKLWLLYANHLPLLHRSVATHLLQKAIHAKGQPSQTAGPNPTEGLEQQDSQRRGRRPRQHMGHQCDDLIVTCIAQQAIYSRFGPDGAFQGVILVLANGNNRAWLSQVHGSLWRIGWDANS